METIASGMRLTPARLNPARCIVTRPAAQSITSGGVGTAVTFTGESVDTHGMWSTGTNVTVQKAGTYNIAGSVIFGAGATGVRAVNLRKNGTTIGEQKRSATNQADPISVAVGDVFAAGDVITLGVFHTQGTALDVSTVVLSVIQTGGV